MSRPLSQVRNKRHRLSVLVYVKDDLRLCTAYFGKRFFFFACKWNATFIHIVSERWAWVRVILATVLPPTVRLCLTIAVRPRTSPPLRKPLMAPLSCPNLDLDGFCQIQRDLSRETSPDLYTLKPIVGKHCSLRRFAVLPSWASLSPGLETTAAFLSDCFLSTRAPFYLRAREPGIDGIVIGLIGLR